MDCVSTEVVGSSPTKAQIFKTMKHESKDSVLVINQRYDALHIRSICRRGTYLVVHDLYLYRYIVCVVDTHNKSKVLGRFQIKRITMYETVFILPQ